MQTKAKLAVACCAILLVAAFLFAPIVPYSQQVALTSGAGLVKCTVGSGPYNTADPSICQAAGENAEVRGYATPAYRFLGYGPGPFPDRVLVTQGNRSALLFFNGTRLEDAGSADVFINPPLTAYIQSAIVASSDYGLLNVSITVKSYDFEPILHPTVYLSLEGFSRNFTVGGVTWMQPRAVGTCGVSLASGAQCTVSQVIDNTLPVNRSFYYSVEVRGSSGGRSFVVRQGYGAQYPVGGVGPRWVSVFISLVNKERTGSGLTENSTLDRFAEIRSVNSSAHYQVSDYGFANDSARFLGINGSSTGDQEVLLYPLTYTPDGYANFLRQYAPGHWFALADPYYSRFGYFIGQGPYYKVAVPCSVYEIPRAGLNITKFFGDQGCTTALVPST